MVEQWVAGSNAVGNTDVLPLGNWAAQPDDLRGFPAPPLHALASCGGTTATKHLRQLAQYPGGANAAAEFRSVYGNLSWNEGDPLSAQGWTKLTLNSGDHTEFASFLWNESTFLVLYQP